jgi:hypothetical protein
MNTGVEGISVSARGSIIAFTTAEYWHGVDLSGDGYHPNDRITRYLDLNNRRSNKDWRLWLQDL